MNTTIRTTTSTLVHSLFNGSPVRIVFEYWRDEDMSNATCITHDGVCVYLDPSCTIQNFSPLGATLRTRSITKSPHTHDRGEARKIWNDLIEMGFRLL